MEAESYSYWILAIFADEELMITLLEISLIFRSGSFSKFDRRVTVAALGLYMEYYVNALKRR